MRNLNSPQFLDLTDRRGGARGCDLRPDGDRRQNRELLAFRRKYFHERRAAIELLAICPAGHDPGVEEPEGIVVPHRRG